MKGRNKMTKKRKLLFGVLCFATLLWTAFIFSRSLKTVGESAAESGAATSFLNRLFGSLHLSEYAVRKMAHFAEYLILALPATLGALQLVRCRLSGVVALGYALLVAVCDEFVVQMISGRGSRVSDVLIDVGGAFLGVLLVIGVVWLVKRHRTC